jgi:hypothetical protein
MVNDGGNVAAQVKWRSFFAASAQSATSGRGFMKDRKLDYNGRGTRTIGVEDSGLEPLTFWLPAKRSPN